MNAMALMIEGGGTNWSLARARALGPEVQVKVTNMDDLINQRLVRLKM